MKFKNIGFIGFGLIAGSIARAIKNISPDCKITATSRSLEPLRQAFDDKILDNIAPEIDNSFLECDLILICTPVATIDSCLKKLKPFISDTCIISDVGSVKGYIMDAAKNNGLEKNFIGGHPMAGSELSGYSNSYASMLENATYILTPTQFSTPNQIEAMREFVVDLKAVPIIMDADSHDYTAAAVSHVPHLSACALTQIVEKHETDDKYMHMLASGGFKDTTRIAASSPEMWSQICLTNKKIISQLLSEYIETLTQMRENIDSETPGYIDDAFTRSRAFRNTFK